MTLIYIGLDMMNKSWLRNHDSPETKDSLGQLKQAFLCHNNIHHLNDLIIMTGGNDLNKEAKNVYVQVFTRQSTYYVAHWRRLQFIMLNFRSRQNVALHGQFFLLLLITQTSRARLLRAIKTKGPKKIKIISHFIRLRDMLEMHFEANFRVLFQGFDK